MWSIDFNLRLLKGVDFVVDDVVAVVANVVVLDLIVVTAHIIFICVQ